MLNVSIILTDVCGSPCLDSEHSPEASSDQFLSMMDCTLKMGQNKPGLLKGKTLHCP